MDGTGRMKRTFGEWANLLWPYLQPKVAGLVGAATIRRSVAPAEGSAPSPHDLNSAHHGGTLADAQAPQFLKLDGSRTLTGNLAVSPGIGIDGVDISAHAVDPDAHHIRATAGDGISAIGALQVVAVDSSVVRTTRNLVAGAGLTGGGTLAADRTFDVGVANTGAAGLSVEADLIRLTSSSAPGAAASVLASDASGYLSLVRLTTSDRLRTPLVDTVSGDLTLAPVGAVALADGKTIRSDNFATGFTGNGWRIAEASGVTDAEFDNLSVRGLMRVYELLIHKIRTGNGSYLFANGGKVAAVSGAGPYTLDFDEDHGLATNDLLLAQKFTGSGTYQSKLTVTGTPTTKQITATLYSGAAPAAGYEYVRIGNSSDANRRGSVYITADDSGAPFVDVIDGIAAHTDWYSASKIKARLGKLDGMTYAGSSISGYGLYSDNVYLNGRLRAGGGIARADDDGFSVRVQSSGLNDPLNAYTMEKTDGTIVGGLYGWGTVDSESIHVRAIAPATGHSVFAGLYAENSWAYPAQVTIGANASTKGSQVIVSDSHVRLYAYNGAASKSSYFYSTETNLASPASIGGGNQSGFAFSLTGRQFLYMNGRGTTYTTMGLELYTDDNTAPGISFHRAGYSALALYEYQEQLWIKSSDGFQIGKIWTSANDGATSTLDAAMLAGRYPTANAAYWNAVPYVGTDGVLEIGRYIDFHETSEHTGNYSARIDAANGQLYFSTGATFYGNLLIPSDDGGLEVNATGGVKIYTNEINVKDNGYLYLGYRNTAAIQVIPTLIVAGDFGGAWNTLSLTSPWTTYDSTNWGSVRYRKVGDLVFLEGMPARPSGYSSSIAIATLPSGYRPGKKTTYVVNVQVAGSWQAGRLDVRADGVIDLIVPSTSATLDWVSFGGVCFSTTAQ